MRILGRDRANGRRYNDHDSELISPFEAIIVECAVTAASVGDVLGAMRGSFVRLPVAPMRIEVLTNVGDRLL